VSVAVVLRKRVLSASTNCGQGGHQRMGGQDTATKRPRVTTTKTTTKSSDNVATGRTIVPRGVISATGTNTDAKNARGGALAAVKTDRRQTGARAPTADNSRQPCAETNVPRGQTGIKEDVSGRGDVWNIVVRGERRTSKKHVDTLVTALTAIRRRRQNPLTDRSFVG